MDSISGTVSHHRCVSLMLHSGNTHEFDFRYFKFTVYGCKQTRLVRIHTHVQCSLASVRLAQARPNNDLEVDLRR